MTFRLMADGIGGSFRDPQLIRARFGPGILVGGYINGSFAWTQAQFDLFDASDRVYITITASADAGDVIDCENGDATPGQAANWVRMRKAAGYDRPTVYCNRSTVADVRMATGSLVLARDYDIWVADWTGAPHEVSPCAATQYVSASSWDLSSVYDSGWPHRTRKTPPPPPPPSKEVTVNVTLPILQQGSNDTTLTGRPVRRVQALVNALHGTSITVDGDYGPATKSAVEGFQSAYKLSVDGIVGQDTWHALYQP